MAHRRLILFLSATLFAACAPSRTGGDAGNPPDEDAGTSHCAPAALGASASDAFRRARTTEDQLDDAPGAYQFHILYVEPSDRVPSPALDTTGAIRRSVTAFNGWFEAKSGGSRLRFDTCEGLLDVTHVKLDPPHTERALATGIGYTPPEPVRLLRRLADLLSPRFNEPNKMYLIYWDGLMFGACGGAPHPPELVLPFVSMFVGGVFRSTFLTADASAGDTSLTIYPTSELGLPTAPFNATLGGESVSVTDVSANGVTLSAALGANHPVGEPLYPNPLAACRNNPYSSNGVQLNYTDYAGAHESLHSLGMVPINAPDWESGGHVSINNPSGTADVMYGAGGASICLGGAPHANPGASPCVLDPTHANYFHPPEGILDLSKSAFLDPLPADALPPPGW